MLSGLTLANSQLDSSIAASVGRVASENRRLPRRCWPDSCPTLEQRRGATRFPVNRQQVRGKRITLVVRGVLRPRSCERMLGWPTKMDMDRAWEMPSGRFRPRRSDENNCRLRDGLPSGRHLRWGTSAWFDYDGRAQSHPSPRSTRGNCRARLYASIRSCVANSLAFVDQIDGRIIGVRAGGHEERPSFRPATSWNLPSPLGFDCVFLVVVR